MASQGLGPSTWPPQELHPLYHYKTYVGGILLLSKQHYQLIEAWHACSAQSQATPTDGGCGQEEWQFWGPVAGGSFQVLLTRTM